MENKNTSPEFDVKKHTPDSVISHQKKMFLEAAKRRTVTRTKTLTPHPLNHDIYTVDSKADMELKESIRINGILTPLLISDDNQIISGHRRWEIAKQLKIKDVPVKVFRSDDELDIQEALIEANRQREKSNEEKAREYTQLKRIIHERESRQGTRSDLAGNGTLNKILSEVDKPSVKAAQQVGMSRTTARNAERVLETIERLEEQGFKDEARITREALGRSVNQGVIYAKSYRSFLKESKPRPKVKGGPGSLTREACKAAIDKVSVQASKDRLKGKFHDREPSMNLDDFSETAQYVTVAESYLEKIDKNDPGRIDALVMFIARIVFLLLPKRPGEGTPEALDRVNEIKSKVEESLESWLTKPR